MRAPKNEGQNPVEDKTPSRARGLKFVIPKEFLPNHAQEFTERPIRTPEMTSSD